MSEIDPLDGWIMELEQNLAAFGKFKHLGFKHTFFKDELKTLLILLLELREARRVLCEIKEILEHANCDSLLKGSLLKLIAELKKEFL